MLGLPEAAPAIIYTEASDVLLVELSTPKDDDAYFDGVQISTAHLQRFEPGIAKRYTSVDVVREAREKARAAGKARFGIWALSDSETAELGDNLDDAIRSGKRPGRFAGSASATTIHETGEIEIGYWRIEEQLRKGCMALGVRALAAHCSLYGRVTANVLPDNRDSIALLRRVGFRPSGDTGPDSGGAITSAFVFDPTQ